MSNMLLETWSLKGSELAEFNDAVEFIDVHTNFEQVHSKDLLLFTYDEEASTQPSYAGTHLCFRRWDPVADKVNIVFLSLEKLKAIGADEALINELKNNTKVLIRANGKLFFTSPMFMGTVASRFRLGGDQFYEPSMKRDEYLTECAHAHPFDATLMYRTEGIGMIRKAFALHSAKYTPCRQTVMTEILYDIEREMEVLEVDNWQVAHSISRIACSFPKRAEDIRRVCKDKYGKEIPDDLTPGITLITSDTGESSITAMETWRVKNSVIYGEIYKKQHRGNFDPFNIVLAIGDKIFSQYTKLPERLCELMVIDVANPGRVYELILQDLKIEKYVGKKVVKALAEELALSVNPTVSYTAYDIAMTMLDMPKRIEGIDSAEGKQKMAEFVIRVPFMNFEALNERSGRTIMLI